jgi:8-oxo-dGTP pyrophosphatase MutT (NUDIX family)
MPTEILKVQVWIHAPHPQGGRQVLLFRTSEERGNFWQPVTGGVEPGEALEAAALREAREESGFAFTVPVRAIGFEFTFSRQGKPIRESCFEIEAPAGQEFRLDPKEHAEARWVRPEDALAMVRFESNAHPLRLLVKKWQTQQELQKKLQTQQ